MPAHFSVCLILGSTYLTTRVCFAIYLVEVELGKVKEKPYGNNVSNKKKNGGFETLLKIEMRKWLDFKLARYLQ